MGIFNRGTADQLWQRYVLALGILVVLLVGGHMLHLRVLQDGANDAETIDLSGRQRMLSQRIAGLAQTLKEPSENLNYEAALLDALQVFEASHADLLARSEDFPSAKAVYAMGEDWGLDAQVQAFVRDVHNAASYPAAAPEQLVLLHRIEVAAFKPLLSNLDKAVKAFAYDAEHRLEGLERMQLLALLLALGLLVLEGAFIFYPAHRSVVLALKAAQERFVQLERRNDDLQKMSERLEYSAHHDQLTGLANRKKLHSELHHRLKQNGQTGQQLCVMHVDLDRFKEINDTLGHGVGDIVLMRAAESMKSRTRKGDLVARVGGDEFVIAVSVSAGPGAKEQATRIAESIIARIREPMLIEGNECTVGASIGFVLVSSDDQDSDRLIADADIALYEAKGKGRGVAVAFEPKMRNGIERRYALIGDLERAIENNEFVPFFQPKVAFSNGRVQGLEVLSRWQHAKRGLLLPGDFIDLAEETGLIDRIDWQVALAGLDALVDFRAQGFDVPTLAVNASAASLRNGDYVADMKLAVAMRGLAPQDVRIEVVESTLISGENDRALSALKDFAASGFKIDIDDFGTGYASLSMLSRLHLSGLKIDRELVSGLERSKPMQIIEAIVGLAKGMNLEVIAEGVESPKQFAALQAAGCDTAQGFGIGHPMSAKDTKLWFESYSSQPNKVTGLKVVG